MSHAYNKIISTRLNAITGFGKKYYVGRIFNAMNCINEMIKPLAEAQSFEE